MPWRALPEPLRGAAALTVAATLATAPLMAFQFDRVSLAALPANLVALPAVAPVMWLGMLSAAAGQVALQPAALLNALNAFCLAHVAAVAHWGATLPGSALELRIGSPAALAATYAGGSALLWVGARLARGPRAAAALAASCAALLALAAPPGPPHHFRAVVPRRRAGRRDPAPVARRRNGARRRRPARVRRRAQVARSRRRKRSTSPC